MPSTHLSEIALLRRRDKQEFVRGFPGMLAPEAAVGKTVQRVAEVGGGHLFLFIGGTFLLMPIRHSSPEELLSILIMARELLEPAQPAAYAELDRRIAAEREAMRLARMEKVLGAVETNLPQIPELREELRRLLDGD